MNDEVISCSTSSSLEEDQGHKDGSCVRITNRSQKMKDSIVARLNRIEGQVRGIKGIAKLEVMDKDGRSILVDKFLKGFNVK